MTDNNIFIDDYGNEYNIFSQKYEKKVETKIKFILDNNRKNTYNMDYKTFRGVKFYNHPHNKHYGMIEHMPLILLADGLHINIDSQLEIEKSLVGNSINKVYLVACYRLWRDNKEYNTLYIDYGDCLYKLIITSCEYISKNNSVNGRIQLWQLDKHGDEKRTSQQYLINIKGTHVTYPRKEFENNNLFCMHFDEFDGAVQKEKENIFKLMVRLHNEIPEVK